MHFYPHLQETKNRFIKEREKYVGADLTYADKVYE